MDVLQLIITTIVAIVGIVAGRIWERFDRQSKKDKEQIEKILEIIPPESEALEFLRQHDFGTSYRKGQTEPFWDLKRLLNCPTYFFLNKKLENAKKALLKELADFDELIAQEIFVSEIHPDHWELPDPNDVLVRRVSIIRARGNNISAEELTQLENEVQNKYIETKKKLNTMADSICKKYDILISEAHMIL